MVDTVATVFWTEESYQFLPEVVSSQRLQSIPGDEHLMGVNMESLNIIKAHEGVSTLLGLALGPIPPME